MTQGKRILAIDGGGIRGILPAMVLAEIEKRSGRPIAEMFDLVAGTSTGGIIALGLTIRNEDDGPRYRAEDLVRLYADRGPEIFPRTLPPWAARLRSFITAKHSPKPLERVLQQYFGKARIKDTLTEVMVPSYDIEARDPYFFKTSKAKADPAIRDHFAWEAARATSAAPTFFPPAVLEVSGTAPRRVLVDGGVFVNNPATCALVEVLSEQAHGPRAAEIALGNPVDLDDYLVVSVGTGEATRPIPYAKAKSWGLAGWAIPVLDVVFDGVSDATDYQLRMLLPDAEGGTARYHRIQTRLDGRGVPADVPKPSHEMDDASPENVRALKALGSHVIADRSEALDALVTRLVKRA